MAEYKPTSRLFENARLIIRHLRGQLTLREQELPNKWLSEDERNKLFLESLTEEAAFRNDFRFFSSLDITSASHIVSQCALEERDVTLWEKVGNRKYAAIITFF